MEKNARRRRFLATCGAAATTALAGCSAGDEQTEADDDGSKDGDAPTTDGDDITSSGDETTADGPSTKDDVEVAELSADGDWPMRGADLENTNALTDGDGPTGSLSELWTFETKRDHTRPVIYDGTVYVNGEERLSAIDLLSGDLQWEVDLEYGWYPAKVVDSTVYITDGGALKAFDPDSGSLRWSEDGGDRTYGEFQPTEDGVLLESDDGPTLSFYDLDAGKVVWSHEPDGLEEFAARCVGPNGTYVVQDSNATFHAYDLATGERTWTANETAESGAGVHTSISIVDDTVYYVYYSDDGTRIVSRDAASGSQNWAVTLEDVLTEMAIANGRIYLGARTRSKQQPVIRVVDAEAGEEVDDWRPEPMYGTLDTPRVVGDTVYRIENGTDGNRLALVGFDAQTGETVFRHGTERSLDYFLAIAADVVCLVSNREVLALANGD